MTSGKKKGKAKKDAAPLPTQNGESDSLSINSGILQVLGSHLACCHLQGVIKGCLQPFQTHKNKHESWHYQY